MTCASDGTGVYLWGGITDQRRPTADGAYLSATHRTWEPIGRAPIRPRFGAVGAWTGSEFMVWGGGGLKHTMRDGATWSPGSGTWRPIPAAPTSAGAGPVWVGDELLVWWLGSEFEQTGTDCLAYRPADDSWRWVPTDGATPRRPWVWTGSELYAWVPIDPRHDLVVYRPD